MKIDKLGLKGKVEFLIYQRGVLVDRFVQYNIIVNTGKADTIIALANGTNKYIARMAIGDQGTLPSDPTVPKVPEASRDALYHEIYRQNVDTVSTTTLNDVNEALFVTTFRAIDVPLTAYSDQVNPVINEVGLIMVNPITGNPMPRPPIAAPAPADADETLFSIRTFKSVPFEAANETSVSVRYTIFIA